MDLHSHQSLYPLVNTFTIQGVKLIHHLAVINITLSEAEHLSNIEDLFVTYPPMDSEHFPLS